MSQVADVSSGARRIFGGALLLSIGQGIGVVSMGLWTVVVARHIGPETYGFYAFAQAVVSVLAIFVSLGLDEVAVRDVARAPGRAVQYLRTIASTKAVTAALVLGAFVAVSSRGATSGEVAIVVIVAAMGAVTALSSLMIALLQARAAMHLVVAGQVANYSLTMVSGIVAVWLDRSFVTVLVLSFAATLVQLALTTFFVLRGVERPAADDDVYPARRDFPGLFRTAVPFAAVAVVAVVRGNMLIILLKAASYSDASLGHFAAAERLAAIILIGPSMVAQVLVPTLSRAFATNQRRFKRMFERAYRYALFVSVPAGLALAVVAPSLLTLVYGGRFAPAGDALRVLCLSLVGAAGYVLAPALVAMDRQNLVARVQVVNLVAIGVVAYLLIPRFGAEGAAWAMVAGALWSLVLYSRILFRTLSLAYPAAWAAKTAVASAVMTALAAAAAERLHYLLVILLVAPVAYVLLQLLLRTLTPADWRFVRSFVPLGRSGA